MSTLPPGPEIPASATPASATPASATPASATPASATPASDVPGPSVPGPALRGPAMQGRRAFLRGAAGIAGASIASGVLAACSSGSSSATAAEPAAGSSNAKPLSDPTHPDAVRVMSVYVPINSGLMDALIQGFASVDKTYTVTTVGGPNVLTNSKEGKVDLAICHYGHTDDGTIDNYNLEQFMDSGYGRWPRPVFFSQAVLVGVPSDPAGIAGMTDMVQAFKQIAASGASYVVDNTDYLPYLGECLLDAAGLEKGSWFLDFNSKSHQALLDTENHNGYTLWGGVPFWTEAESDQTTLKPYLWADPSFQRMMVSVVVNPAAVAGVNADGATAFQEYLLSQEAQGLIRDFRVSGFQEAPLFWPAGANNDPFDLPNYAPDEAAVNPGAAPGAGSGG